MRLGLLFGVLVCCAIACGGGAPKSMTTAPPTAGGVMPPTQRAEIERLAGEIKAGVDKLQLQVAAPLLTDPIPTADSLAPPTSDATCKPAQTDACKDTCTLADSICNNAKRICEIASEMNDAWANGKCHDGKASCDAARTSCCGCA